MRSHRSIRFADSHSDPLAFIMRICDECLREFAIPDGVTTMPLELSLDAHPQLAFPAMLCAHCFRDYREANATIHV